MTRRRPAMTRREFFGVAALPFLRQNAKFIRIVPFVGSGRTPLERRLNDGLDARMFTDLSMLAPDRLVIPTDKFFIRTAAPPLPPASGWTIAVGGLVRQPVILDLASLERASRPAGRILIECAGNTDPGNYGLMSVAEWEGAPIDDILDRTQPANGSRYVLVSGFDHEASVAGTSVPGASWIFSRDDLRRAVLALRMNGKPLPLDHGAPVRLIVPGWYGCACIKWVNRIEFVADDVAPTSQMIEFARRTHQPFDSLGAGPPALAREYLPAVIDTAATPIRVEQWNVDGRTEYRLVGIIWGGEKPTNALAIRFKTTEPWAPVENCPLSANTLTWSLWTHTWRPRERGEYDIVLKVTDPTMRTRRLDLFYYVREVVISEV